MIFTAVRKASQCQMRSLVSNTEDDGKSFQKGLFTNVFKKSTYSGTILVFPFAISKLDLETLSESLSELTFWPQIRKLSQLQFDYFSSIELKFDIRGRF